MIGLAAGRHAEAFACVWRVFDPADPAHHPYLQTIAISTLAEAAVSDEERAVARDARSRLAESAATTTARLIKANLGFAHALLADDEDAEAPFRSVLDLDLSRDPFTRARILLAYGAWLRRRRRVMESRAPLRIARESFASLGAQPWHEPRVPGTPLRGRGGHAEHARELGSAHAAGTADRAAGLDRALQPGDWPAALPLPPHHRSTPVQDLSEAGDLLPWPVAGEAPAGRW